MKVADWRRIVGPLLKDDASWRVHQRLVYAYPVGTVLRGVLADGNAYDSLVHLWRVSMPLCLDFPTIALSYSERDPRKYGDDSAALVARVRHLLDGMPTEEDERLRYSVIFEDQPNPTNALIQTCTQVVLRNYDAARRTVAAASGTVAKSDWALKDLADVRALGAALDADPGAAIDIVDARVARTMERLGLS